MANNNRMEEQEAPLFGCGALFYAAFAAVALVVAAAFWVVILCTRSG